MRLSVFLAVLLPLASAQNYNISSAPFRLVLSSSNSTVNNDTISACHIGAAIESLCLSHGYSLSAPTALSPAIFTFNTSSSTYPPPNADTIGTPGILAYNLPSVPPIPSSLTFDYDPLINYALPALFPGFSSTSTRLLAFDNQNRLNVQGYVDYSSPQPVSGETKAYYRWWVCATYYSGYQYRNLVWGLGEAAPETGGCESVTVKRMFV